MCRLDVNSGEDQDWSEQYLQRRGRHMCIAPDFSSKQVQPQTNRTEGLHF